MYVPQLTLSQTALHDRVERLAALLQGRRVAVLTGAGCSTESGIPDYRGPETRKRARNPVQYRAFLSDPAARQRYWARALVGYARFADKQPNAAHRALSTLERAGRITGVITQNVDDLHERAGSARVVALHGSLSVVRCLDCGAESPRAALQTRLQALNPGFAQRPVVAAPDGDAELPPAAIDGFVVAACEACGGVLKPAVVFFGENVPPARVAAAYAMCDAADALLVVGSSLQVFSGLRFVRRAAAAGVPVAIVNVGTTRGDEHAQLRIEALAGDVLPALAQRLCGGSPVVR